MNFNLMVIDFVVFMVFMGGIPREFPRHHQGISDPHRNSSEVLANEGFISYFL